MIADYLKKIKDDKEKEVIPIEIKPKVCKGCLAETRNTMGWLWFNFKYLEPSWLCPTCKKIYSEKLSHLQEQGL